MMKKSYREIQLFLQVAAACISKNERETKFKYALRRVMKSFEKIMTGFHEQCEMIDIDFCRSDADGVILRDAKGELQFTKDNYKKRNVARNELFESEVEIKPFMIKNVPNDLSAIEYDAFVDFVIPAEELEYESV